MKTKKYTWLCLILVAAAISLIALSQSKQAMTATPEDQEEVAVEAEESHVETQTTSTESSRNSIGDPDAPVKIQEFASLSCPHCASFHKEIFPKLKEEYIDTGKVYFTFTNFPLNAPALEGAMIAHCLPKDKYFKFIKFLFDTQEKWAFEGKHTQTLRQNAKLLGLSDEEADTCLADNKLRMDLVQNIKDAQAKHEIKSTPSFVINGTHVVSGSHNYESFKEEIEKLLK